MGTWSAAIFGNDTACEVKEYFFEQYNAGKEPKDIQADIETIYATALNDVEDHNNILFALAHCLWQTKAEDPKLWGQIEKSIQDGSDLATLEKLGVKKPFLTERQKVLNKFWNDISTPKETAKKRIKPPVPVDSPYKNGACLAFLFQDGTWGVAITANSQFFKRKATLYFAQTDIKSKTLPTMQDVYTAHLLDDSYEPGRGLWMYGAHFFGTKNIAHLTPYSEAFFTIIGYLPPWLNAYRGSRNISISPKI